MTHDVVVVGNVGVDITVSLPADRRPLAESVRRGQLAARWACAVQDSSAGLVTAAELDRLSAAASPR